jgi:hypothetical protein
MRLFPIALVVFCGAAAAQTGSFSAPVAGYVFDSAAQALRPVLGIPGAATLGAPINSSYSLTAAYVAPKLDSYFGIASDGSVHWFSISSGVFQEGAVSGLAASPERVVFSPSGTAAALFANGQAQLLTGLPSTPSIAGTISLDTRETQRARRVAPALAVSDDGAYMLAAMNGSVQLAGKNGVARPVIQTGSAAVVAFAAGGHDAVIAAPGAGAILIRDVPGTAVQTPLASDGPAFTSPAGIGFSADSSHVFLASASAQTVSAFDLSGNRTDMPCSCSPAELTPMGGSFRLTELASDPLWLLDAGATGPRVVFVPALKAAQ